MEGAAEEPGIGVLEEVWASIVLACQGIDQEQWALPTDCPGWTVRDQISHLIGIERVLLGDPSPSTLADEAVPAHVKNPFGRINEAWVEARRSTPGPEVLDEFEVVTARRLEALRSMPADRFEVVGWSPVGEVPYREFMAVRGFDSWVHEQDIRRALDRPGGRGGAGEAVTLQRIASAMGYVVGRNVAPPDGTAVVWRLTGPLARQLAVVMEGGRGRSPEAVPDQPTVLFDMGTDVFWRLGCGRVSATEALDGGAVVVGGDAVLARKVLEAMSVVP